MSRVASFRAIAPVAILVAMAGLGAPQRASALTVLPPPFVASQVLEGQLREGMFLEQYLNQIMGPFRQLDRDSTGITAEMLKARRQMREAQERANLIAQAERFDLNGDGDVAPEEFAAFLNRKAEYQANPNDLERFDIDGDGRATFKEILQASGRIAQNNLARRDDAVEALMTLPAAADGRLTAAELEAAARAVFEKADLDGDHRISADEYRQFRVSLPPALPRPAIEPVYCPLPPVDPRDLLAMFGAYQGLAERGTVSHPTGRATVVIEPGRQPLYLILPSYEAIRWTLTGAVGRVRQVVLTSYEHGDAFVARGVVGIPATRVRIFGYGDCIHQFNKLDSPEATAARAAVVTLLGRAPDVMAAAYTAAEVSLPSATIAPAPPALGSGSLPRRVRPGS